MKTNEPKTNRNKNFSKYLLTSFISVLFTLNINAKTNIERDTLGNKFGVEKHKLEKALVTQEEDSDIENLEINEIEVIELEEEVELGFDTSKYLPKNFNPLKGKNDLDWNAIELVELEEEVELGFDTSKYLPKNFNPLKGKNDLDWNAIEIVELEEEVEINFDTKAHLPCNFNPYEGMTKKINQVVVSY